VKALGQLVKRLAGLLHHFEHTQGGQQSIARGGLLHEDEMAGLFAADRRAALHHFLEHILVAHRRADQPDPVAFERALEPEVRHHCGYHHRRAVLGMKPPSRVQVARHHQQHRVAIDDRAGRRHRNAAVRIAVKGKACRGPFGHHPCAELVHVRGAAFEVNVAAIGLGVRHHQMRAQAFECFRPQPRRRAVAAIEHDFHAIEASGESGEEVLKIPRIQPCFDFHHPPGGFDALGEQPENDLLNLQFFAVRQLVAGVASDLDAVVLKRIVRGRNHHARHKRIILGEVGDAGRGDDASKASPHAFPRQAACHLFRDPGSRFTGIHTDDHFGRFPGWRMRPAPGAQSRTRGMHCARI